MHETEYSRYICMRIRPHNVDTMPIQCAHNVTAYNVIYLNYQPIPNRTPMQTTHRLADPEEKKLITNHITHQYTQNLESMGLASPDKSIEAYLQLDALSMTVTEATSPTGIPFSLIHSSSVQPAGRDIAFCQTTYLVTRHGADTFIRNVTGQAFILEQQLCQQPSGQDGGQSVLDNPFDSPLTVHMAGNRTGGNRNPPQGRQAA